jgi:ketosteroid isomerase-like protein
VISPAALIIRVRDGRIARAEAHLSDEATLIAVGLIPRPR